MINLLPQELKEEIRYARFNLSVISLALLIIIVSLALSGVLIFGTQIIDRDETRLKKSIAAKERQYQELSGDISKAEKLAGKIDTVSALLDREVTFSQLIKDIGALIPDGARLASLSLTGDPTKPVSISAVVDKQETAAVLRENIAQSPLFQTADIQAITVGETDQSGKPLNFNAVILVQFAINQEEAGQ